MFRVGPLCFLILLFFGPALGGPAEPDIAKLTEDIRALSKNSASVLNAISASSREGLITPQTPLLAWLYLNENHRIRTWHFTTVATLSDWVIRIKQAQRDDDKEFGNRPRPIWKTHILAESEKIAAEYGSMFIATLNTEGKLPTPGFSTVVCGVLVIGPDATPWLSRITERLVLRQRLTSTDYLALIKIMLETFVYTGGYLIGAEVPVIGTTVIGPTIGKLAVNAVRGIIKIEIPDPELEDFPVLEEESVDDAVAKSKDAVAKSKVFRDTCSHGICLYFNPRCKPGKPCFPRSSSSRPLCVPGNPYCPPPLICPPQVPGCRRDGDGVPNSDEEQRPPGGGGISVRGNNKSTIPPGGVDISIKKTKVIKVPAGAEQFVCHDDDPLCLPTKKKPDGRKHP